jgi:hypothetical protein
MRMLPQLPQKESYMIHLIRPSATSLNGDGMLVYMWQNCYHYNFMAQCSVISVLLTIASN